MSIQEWFDKRKEAQIERRSTEVKVENINFPGLWTKCVHCETQLLKTELEENMMVCPHCDYHYRISARKRISPHRMIKSSFPSKSKNVLSKELQWNCW